MIETITSALYDKRRKTVERSIDMRESAEMHREIYRAIRARKPQEARKLMEEHLRMAQTRREWNGRRTGRHFRARGGEQAAGASRTGMDWGAGWRV